MMSPVLATEFLPPRLANCDSLVVVDCLLPTGVLVPVTINIDASLTEIKKKLWDDAGHYPLFSCLLDMNCYIFICVNNKAKKEELIDETRRFRDIQIFYPLLKIIERKGNRDEKLLDSRIGFVIGKGINEFEGMHSTEVSDFRSHTRKLCEDIAEKRSKLKGMDLLMYYCPPELCKTNIDIKQEINILVHLPGLNCKFMFRRNVDCYPCDLIEQVLEKRETSTGTEVDSADKYLLKICGVESYITDVKPLINFKYIVNCILMEKIPTLSLVEKQMVIDNLPGQNQPPQLLPRKSSLVPPSIPAGLQEMVTTWEIDEKTLVTVFSISNVKYPDNTKLWLRMGIFHGGEGMCSIVDSKPAQLWDGRAKWDTYMCFDLTVVDLPRMSRLCIALYTNDYKCVRNKTLRVKDSKVKQEMIPLSWVNITMFDYKNRLRTGSYTLQMWPYDDYYLDLAEILNPIGTVVDNPNKVEAPSLDICFSQYGIKHTIIYPPYEKVVECAAKHAEYTQVEISPETVAQLETALSQDPLQVLHDQEIDMIWKYRLECREKFPDALPRLLSCVKWNRHSDVAQMQELLRTWPQIPAEQSLELLDFCYADKSVRRFAVDILHSLTNEDFIQYLLQLVQALKYESYLECDLVEFLIKRALSNMKIGHHFFWLLRSEMHLPSVSVQFGLLLEAYCRGARNHIAELTRQHTALSKLQELNDLIKTSCLKTSSEKVLEEMKLWLSTGSYVEDLSNLTSTLDRKYCLKELQLDKCKFMDSKMKPLFLVWKNKDIYGDNITFIFKNGDDLRQDMLTIQILKIMDRIWQSENLDLRLIPYGCIATGHCCGLIEVVLNAKTLRQIHMEYRNSVVVAAAFQKFTIHAYLKHYNTDYDSFAKAIEEFTLSCAGYCVASYVLGIGDRHSGNIMVTESGRLFHIDFGHFLGNFKSKLGLKRERVPFVLTNDFVCVIQADNTSDKKADKFKRFQNICEGAYMILRSKGNYLISLFMLMLSTGIPELTCAEDIHYLRETLALHMSDEAALKHFRSKFKEAVKNSWKTQLNWFAHEIAHA